ncbi:asparagine synthetase domain-containing protein 1 [Brevipalpus obovatus]|uniref:asparagine synthetase domain-containing protein 1 n=1 Tax=Brevipalpus obovatus TaxID=246614 RepID=UPI003D9E586B
MCGIFFGCQDCDSSEELISDHLKLLLRNRGPDFTDCKTLKIDQLHLLFMASVLHMRGTSLTQQPVLDDHGNILLFNGEIFSDFHSNEFSDTQFLSQKLSLITDEDSFLEVITQIKGPFALIYYQSASKLLWFGRDIVGRKSLCWLYETDPFRIKVSSVCEPHGKLWTEVPAQGFYSLNLDSESSGFREIKCSRWSKSLSGTVIDLDSLLISPIKNEFNDSIPNALQVFIDTPQSLLKSFQAILEEAIRKRCDLFSLRCDDCIKSESTCNHSSVGILFSGGLDSTVLAILSDKFIPNCQSIDLLNVAFSENAPDRETGLIALEELQVLCPKRKWNFVAINISKAELEEARDTHIKYLVKPLETVLDDSIACALWFAAQGKGKLQCSPQSASDLSFYSSPARVVLVGMGADEQLAGYSRHQKVFNERGYTGLVEEMRMEIDRISQRNLGRDDRVISDLHRDARFPFLDEDVIDFLHSLPVYQKVNLTLGRGHGEKLLLRNLATKLGLKKTAFNWKRAIQFGSRIAKLESKNEKGDSICTRLHSQ